MLVLLGAVILPEADDTFLGVVPQGVHHEDVLPSGDVRQEEEARPSALYLQGKALDADDGLGDGTAVDIGDLTA